MNCVICDRGMPERVALYRCNEKGVPGIWGCETHAAAVKRVLEAGYPDPMAELAAMRQEHRALDSALERLRADRRGR